MLRIGFIGFGGMAEGLAKAVAGLAGRAALTAVADVDEARRARAAELYPQARMAADYRDILPEVDAAVLPLPHHLHHPIGLDCLAAGKHVFMEKPLANTEAQCRELIDAADAAERVLMVGYVMRFHPLVRALKAALDDGRCGEPFQVSIWTEQLTRWPAGQWGRDADCLGGGQLFSHGCHYVDLLLWLLGRPVSGVHVGTNRGTPWMQREGTSNLVLHFDGGAMGYHFGTWGARGTRLGYAIHAHCTGGMLEADLHRGELIFHRGREADQEASEGRGTGTETPSGVPPSEPASTVGPAPPSADRRGRGVSVPVPDALETRQGPRGRREYVLQRENGQKPIAAEIEHFVDCAETGTRPQTDGRASLPSLQVIWRVYAAEEAGRLADLRDIERDTM